MIRRVLCGAAALLALLAAAPGAAAGERIRDFRTDITLDADGSFEVEERIVYDFDGARKHGIYREIPVRYGRGSAPDYRIALDVLWVRDGHGDARPWRESSRGIYRRIRIGDPERTVTGVQEYRLRYRVRRGVLWLETHDELYWNATGTEWRVPIDAAEVSVATPAERPDGALRSLCFTGPRGSVETACTHASDASMAHFETDRGLGPGEGLTVVVAVPKGALREPSELEKWLDRASDYVSWASALPFLAFGGFFAHWWRNGRDRGDAAAAVAVRYEPPEGMTPAEMGTVLDEKVDLKDVTATILDLAVRGQLRIEEVESRGFLFLSQTDYVLRRTAPPASGAGDRLRPHEQKLLLGLFDGADSVTLSSLKNEFYKKLPGIREALYESVSRARGWFPASPDAVRKRYAVIGLAVTLPLAAIAFFVQSAPALLSLLACAAIAFFWSRFMPRRTAKGRKALQHIRGFEEFLERVEADRLERLGMNSVETFERMLPYAFVLGVADAWAEAFADIYREPPSWFSSRSREPFRSSDFVDRLGRTLDTAGSALSSQPRGSGSSGFSSGGGFSGGGFGGGGGGSW